MTRRWLETLSLLLIVLATALPAGVQAQEGVRARIGLIDVQRVLRDAQAAKGVRPQMDAVRKKFQEQVREQERVLREAAQRLASERIVLSSDVFIQKRRELDERSRQTQLGLQDRRRGLDAAFNRTRDTILREMVVVAQEVAKSSDVDIVLERRVVFIPAKSLDLTEDVIKLLDERLPSVKLELEDLRQAPEQPDAGTKN